VTPSKPEDFLALAQQTDKAAALRKALLPDIAGTSLHKSTEQLPL